MKQSRIIIAILVTIIVGFIITISTVFIPNTVNSVDELRINKIGLPLRFVTQELTYDPPADSYPLKYAIQSTWEMVTKVNTVNLTLSWLIISSLILGVIILVYKANDSYFNKPISKE